MPGMASAQSAADATRTGALPQYTFDGEASPSDRVGVRVNVANGNLMVTDSDLSIAGTGQRLSVARVFNGFQRDAGAPGGGWSLTTSRDVRLAEQSGGDVLFHGPGGYVVRFVKQSTGDYSKPSGLNIRLDKTSTGFTVTQNVEDTKMLFSSGGRLVEQVDKNGHKISFDYGPNGEPASITDTQGRVTRFTTNANGTVTSMTDPIGRVFSYEHEYNQGQDRLRIYTDPAGQRTEYSYDGERRLALIRTPGLRTVAFQYYADGRVRDVDHGGSITRFEYAQAGTQCPSGERNTVVTDPNGNKTTYCWDTQGRVDAVYDALGHKQAREYDSQSNVLFAQGAGGTAAPWANSTLLWESYSRACLWPRAS